MAVNFRRVINHTATILFVGLTLATGFAGILTLRFDYDIQYLTLALGGLTAVAGIIVTLTSKNPATVIYNILHPQERSYTPTTIDRANMLEQCRFRISSWRKDLLQNITYYELGIQPETDAVSNDSPMTLEIRGQVAEKLQQGGQIADEVFERVAGQLLILGNPGSGKTATLLELASALIERAIPNADYPIPVYLNMASWSGEQTLDDWILDEMALSYKLPKPTGQAWLDAGHILPLLDGLDEGVRQDIRVQKINQFRAEHGFVKMVVCSRITNYEALNLKLELNAAVRIEPLSLEQVVNAIAVLPRQARKKTSLRQLLNEDNDLLNILQTPLFLNILLLSFRDDLLNELKALAPITRHHYLFNTYVERRFERGKVGKAAYSEEHTRLYLHWLAAQMKERQQTEFFIEHLQPDWMVETYQLQRLWHIHKLKSIHTVELIKWSWESFFATLKAHLTTMLYVGMFFGTSVWLINSFILGFNDGLAAGIPAGLAGGLEGALAVAVRNALVTRLPSGFVAGIALGMAVWVAVGLNGGTIEKAINLKMSPNEGIHRSAQSFQRMAPIYITVYVMVFAFATTPMARLLAEAFGATFGQLFQICFITMGLVAGLSVAFFYKGGLAVFNHHLLVNRLAQNGCIPHDENSPLVNGLVLRLLLGLLLGRKVVPDAYARFLDYAASLRLLVRVGGGYRFIHNLLRDHFAEMGDITVPEPAKR